MSMLSDQIIKLLDRADELSMLAKALSAPYIESSTKLTMFHAMESAASEMRVAADTIRSLRDKLQKTTEIE